jgi:two-component system response regulator YesN
MRLLNVAVVDKDPAIVRAVSVVLNRSQDRAQLDINYFTDSVEALDWIQTSTCDVVITGLEMPVITGLEITRAAKSSNAHAQVIVLSERTTPSQAEELAEAGACELLGIPLDKLLLRDLAEQAIARVRRWNQTPRFVNIEKRHSVLQSVTL